MANNRLQYNEHFLEELKKLNPAQRNAVEQIDGPVLVVAGPGTGKTHILASRIGRILMETDSQAQNILCLTFTDAGVKAMRQRLLKLIGPEAHKVHIFTFHSFCNNIIQDNLALFGKQNLESITELEQVEIIREILDTLDLDHPLRKGKVQRYFYEKHLRHLFQLMKSEDWTAPVLDKAITDFLQSLPDREEYKYKRKSGTNKKGDLKEGKYLQQLDRMGLLEAGIKLFDTYNQKVFKANRYDYADMINWVIKAFQNHDYLLRAYQEQYHYFLVDEYQDTNGAQNEILKLLTSFWELPNLFIVGDDDQSIFEFQGARLKNLTDYYYRFKGDMQVVILTNNYRSSQTILDHSKTLIDHNTHRITNELRELNLEKKLVASHPEFKKRNGILPTIQSFPNPLHEQAALLQQVQAFHKQGIPWHEMAVIYARHAQVLQFQRLLDKSGIPYQTRRKTNILDTPLIRQWRMLLQYFQHEQQQAFSGEHQLFKILHFRCWEISPIDLARISQATTQNTSGKRLPWRSFLQQKNLWPDQLLSVKQLTRAANWLEEIIGVIEELSLPALAEKILNDSGLLRQALKADDRLWQVQIYKSFFDFICNEVQRNPRLTLQQLLISLEQMDANYIPLHLQKDIELADGIQLLTAHSSKGLEFRCVFILDATKGFWEPNKRGSNTRFALPDTITRSGESHADEARRRLFYVAMTRAKEHLHISFSQKNAKGKVLQPCAYLDELMSNGELGIQERALQAGELLDIEQLYLEKNSNVHLPALEKLAIAKMLESFQVSISAMSRYLECPLRFFYESLLQAPQFQSEAASYGLAIHNSLQYLFDAMMMSIPRQFPSEAKLVGVFHREMDKLAAYFSAEGFVERKRMGTQNLRLYYQQHHDSWPKQSRTEVRITQTEIEGVPVKGVIDRIDEDNNDQIVILDYKTGSHKKEKVATPTPAKPNGGTYWRQVTFYKLLYESKFGSLKQVKNGTISYVDTDKNQDQPEHTFSFNPELTRQFKALLKLSYTKIMAQEFYVGCGKPNCSWCQFVKDNQSTPHDNEDIESLDDSM